MTPFNTSLCVCSRLLFVPFCIQLDDPSVFPAVIVEQVPAADLMQVYSGLEADELTNGIMVDTTLHVVEEPILGGGVDLTGTGEDGRSVGISSWLNPGWAGGNVHTHTPP